MSRGGWRKGSGRKPDYKHEKKEPITLSLSSKIIRKLQNFPASSVSSAADNLLRRALKIRDYTPRRPTKNEHTLFVLDYFRPVFNFLLKNWETLRPVLELDVEVSSSVLFDAVNRFWPDAKLFAPFPQTGDITWRERYILYALLTGIELIKIAITDPSEIPQSVPSDILEYRNKSIHQELIRHAPRKDSWQFRWLSRRNTSYQIKPELAYSSSLSQIFYGMCNFHITSAFSRTTNSPSNGELWVGICPYCGRLFEINHGNRIFDRNSCRTANFIFGGGKKISHPSHTGGMTWDEYAKFIIRARKNGNSIEGAKDG